MKFIRGLIYPNANASGRGTYWRLKWIYEFWGFCINGGASTTVPGGFASNNGVVFPTNFTDGTSLMASGTDGSHTAVSGQEFSGDCLFTANSSAPFTPSMVGKALVIWKPNSNSSEDSIYVITRVISSTQLIFNCNTGGTPDAVSKRPSMTSRTGVNYRIVDMVNATDSAYSLLGGYMVLNLDAASINPGQGNVNGQSQIQLMSGSRGAAADAGAPLSVSMSGPGAWRGNAFTITGATNASPIQITTSTSHGFTTGQAVSIVGVGGNLNANGNWFITTTGSNTFTLNGSVGNGTYTGGTGTCYDSFPNDGYTAIANYSIATGSSYTSGQTCVNLIGDKTFLIAHLREQDLFQSNGRLCMHFEVPLRLYPQEQDKHPLVFMGETISTGSLLTNSTTASYGGGFIMSTHKSDLVPTRNYRTLVKAMRGDGTPDVFGQQLTDYRIGYNTVAGTIPISEAVLSLVGIVNQFTFARVKLRTVRFTGTHVPPQHRMGLNGEFIQMQNGICWPWDNTIIPHQMLLFGSG